ncbi:MAG: DNA double-strand break repair nuclease NurA [Candidatus Micrarchaeota archaeon]
MLEKLGDIAERIRNSRLELSRRANAVRSADPSLVLRAQKAPLSISVCAVDGGLLAHRMHGADIAVVRALSVNFVYEGSALKSFSHHPGKDPPHEIEIKSSLDEHESNVFRSLVRLRSELSAAIEALRRFSPHLLLMDGSLLPLPSDRPPEGSELASLYSEVVSLYSSLFSLSKEKNCMLLGVIKDSRSRRLAKPLGFACPDTVLCEHLLREGERTKSMPYSDEKQGNAAGLASGILAFYIRPSKHDIPLRIELLGDEEEKAASLVFSLSAVSENFAYPAILVEADLCAALDAREMERIESSLERLSGLRPLRRNSRPFR